MPSPVWGDREPFLDSHDILDELVLDEDDDEYFDQLHLAKWKPTSNGAGAPTLKSADAPRKRRKLSVEGHMQDARPLRPAPIVVWRTEGHSSVSYPIVSDGVDAGVALLEDWRERLKSSVNSLTHGVKRHSSQTAFAVVIERRQKNDLGKQDLLPVENTRRGSAAKQKKAKSQLQHVRSTATPKRKANNKPGSSATAMHRPALAQNRNTTATASMKRKAPETDDEVESQLDDGVSARPKKRLMTQTKRPSRARASRSASVNKEPMRGGSEPKSEASKLRPKRNRARPETAGVANVELNDKSKTKSAVKRSIPKKS